MRDLLYRGLLSVVMLSGCVTATGNSPLADVPSEDSAIESPRSNPEVNVVGIYESHGGPSYKNYPDGAFSLHVNRQGPQILVLTSYEPVTWTVTAAEGAQITKIIASGYHAQTVNGPAGVPVVVLSYEQTKSWLGCGYEYPDQNPTSGCETPELFSAVEANGGAEITSFHGCYQMSQMTLQADLSATGNCSVREGYSLTSYIKEEPTGGAL